MQNSNDSFIRNKETSQTIAIRKTLMSQEKRPSQSLFPNNQRITALLLAGLLSVFPRWATAENIIFPPGANVLNIKEMGAKGDGVTDDTEAIRAAISNGKFIYFPNGTYLVSDQITFPKGGSNTPNRVILQGQSKAGTVIKLQNNCRGYDGNPSYEWEQGTTLTVETAGPHTFDVSIRSDGFGLDKILLTKASWSPASEFQDGPPQSPISDGRFVESDGMLVMEAENCHVNKPGTGRFAGSEWLKEPHPTASGGFAMKTQDKGLSSKNFNPDAPKMTFNVTIKNPGKYRVWLRRIGIQDGGDVLVAYDNTRYTTPFNNVNGTTKTIFRVSSAPEQAFRNAVRNMTINIGKGNSGADGIRFYASNQGNLEDVLVVSEDGAGAAGVNLAFSGGNGPLLLKNVTVEGFRIGINGAAGHSATLENIVVKNQKSVGISCERGNLFVNNLTSTQSSNIPAMKGAGHVVLLNANVAAPSGSDTAVEIGDGANTFIRNLSTVNYSKAISCTNRDATGPQVAEWSSQPPVSLFPSATTSLNLPIKSAPEVEWEQDMNQWANALDYGAPVSRTFGKRTVLDYSPCVQAAIDSGKTTVYLPKKDLGYQNNFYSDIYIRGNVKRLMFMETSLQAPYSGTGQFILEEGTAPVVVFERIDATYGELRLVQASSRTLVVRNLALQSLNVLANTGDVFLEDITGDHSQQMLSMAANTNVWARQLNPEGGGQASSIRNHGGNLWVFGMKTEGGMNKLFAQGGKNEIYSFIFSNNGGATPVTSILDFVDSKFSAYISEDAAIRNKPFDIKVRESRGAETLTLESTGIAGAQIPLIVGYLEDSPNLPPPPNGAPSELTTKALSPSQIQLQWVDNSTNEDGFKVERSATVGAAFWEQVAQLSGPNNTTYTDANLPDSTRYFYRVRAFNSGGTSNYSNQADGLTQPAGPNTIIISHSAPANGDVNLTEEGALDWAVWGATDKSSFNQKATGGKISNWAPVSKGHNRTEADTVKLVWSDGNAPATKGSSVSFVRVGGGPGRGYEFTVEADSTPKTLVIYAMMQYSAKGVLKLSFADGSAPKEVKNLRGDSRVTIHFKAASPTKLQVQLTTLDASGNLGLRGACLKQGWEPVRLIKPNAPTFLSARPKSNSRIEVAWQDNSPNESAFMLERAPDSEGIPGSWTQVALLPPNSTEYSDSAVSVPGRYWYRVRAKNAGGESAYSLLASASSNPK